MSTTVIYDADDAPRVTLTLTDELGYECVVEIDGLEPTRSATAEERAAGIVSLEPPTVHVAARASRYDTHRALLDASWRAVSASATSTTGVTGGPAELVMVCWRVTAAVRHAVRVLAAENSASGDI